MDGHRDKLSPLHSATRVRVRDEQASPLPTYVGHGEAVSGELLTARTDTSMFILSTLTSFTVGMIFGYMAAVVARKFMEPEGHLG